MTLHFLRPKKIGNYAVEYTKGAFFGIDVIVWRDEHRHDGFLVTCNDWGEVHTLVNKIQASVEERQPYG